MVWGSDWPHTSVSPARMPPYESTLLLIRSVLNDSQVQALLHEQARELYA